MLVFEDVQWADAALLDFVDLLADRAGTLPLLIVCTARPELLEQRPSWGGGKTNAMTISLSPLSADNTARLIGELLDQSVLPAEVQQGLLARAEGNPLYAQEYVRMLQDRGLLVPEGRSWMLTGAVDGLPESIHGIIAARLDTLTPAEKALMQDASVVGKTAWVGAVCSLSDRSPWEAEELVHALERRQLLHRMRRSTIQGEIEFTFGHALTRDVAYSQIRRADRATKHEAAAMWIERLAGDRDDKAELLADHYQQALQLLEQLGEDTSALAPRARAAFVEAAKQAAATYAYPAAARHYRAALRLTPADSMADNAALLMGEAVALFNAGRADGKVLQAAVDAQVAVGDWHAAAQAEQMLSRWYQEDAASAEDADVHLDRAAEYAARVPPSDVTFLIAYDQAFRLMTTGDGEAAYRLTSEMIPLAEQAGVDVGRAMMMIFHGSNRAGLGDAGGVEEMRAAAEMLAGLAYPRTPVAYGNLGETLCGLGDLRGAASATAAGLEWAATARDVDLRLLARRTTRPSSPTTRATGGRRIICLGWSGRPTSSMTSECGLCGAASTCRAVRSRRPGMRWMRCAAMARPLQTSSASTTHMPSRARSTGGRATMPHRSRRPNGFSSYGSRAGATSPARSSSATSRRPWPPTAARTTSARRRCCFRRPRGFATHC